MNPETSSSEATPDISTPVPQTELAATDASEANQSAAQSPFSAPEVSAIAPEKAALGTEVVAFTSQQTAFLEESGAAPEETVAVAEETVAVAEETVAVAEETVAVAEETVALAPESSFVPTIRPENAALTVIFSPVPDAPFQTSLALNLSCVRPTAQIYYALGAEDVGEKGLLFDSKEKILLTQNTLVAARAFDGGERGPLLVGNFEIKKALWQEVEPADSSDAVAHKLSENGVCEDGWKISVGSVRGKLHAHRGLWREDSFGFGEASQNGMNWQIVAVSDGAGSAPLSRIGSKIVCETAVADLQNSLADLGAFALERSELETRDLPLVRAALVQAASGSLEAIRAEAIRRNQPLAAFAATLLILVRREWNGKQLCASMQIGDGAIALLDGAQFQLLGEADHGQHSSETRFLTTKGIEFELAHRFKVTIKDDLRAILLASDGVSDDYFPEEKRVGEVFEAVLPLLESESDGGAALISWLGYEKKGSSDDRTLLVSWKGNE